MIYSTNLALGALGTSSANLYTSPAGVTTVVREIDLYSFSGATDYVVFGCNVAGIGATFWYFTTLAPAQTYQWKGRLVIPAGQVINGFAQSANNTYVISGYQLT